MSYAPLSLSPIDDNHPASDNFDDDAISILSNAAPHSGYIAYRPPPPPQSDLNRTLTPNLPPTLDYSQKPRIPTPPIHHPISWPGIFPPRTPSQIQSHTRSPAPSLGFRSHLFGRDQAYEEPFPWAESTHFRSTSHGSKPEIHGYTGLIHEHSGLIQNVSPLSKVYFRQPRHIRRPWTPGFTSRFPWKGFGSLSLVCLLTGSCVAILFAAVDTRPGDWPRSTQPPTYLSILELLIVLLMLCGLREGVRIEFWTRLMRGTTIGNIHDAYEARGLWSAIRGVCRLRWNRVGVATIETAVSMARGPMFQRALFVRSGVYEVDVVFMVIGIILSMVGVISIMPLYYGYWELGRHVDLNPLEIARAFGALLFDGVDGNVTAQDIELERGHLSVRYGAVERNGEEKMLRIQDTSRANVRMPREREIFG